MYRRTDAIQVHSLREQHVVAEGLSVVVVQKHQPLALLDVF